MLPKKNRVTKRDVDLLFKAGRYIGGANLSFKFLLNKGGPTKISFIVPKSVAKLAVKRNGLRRCGYRAIQKYLQHFPAGLIGVFVFKKYQDDIKILENEIENVLHKIN